MSEKRKPNFVGIGVPRGGTTWLHEFVNSHPNAYTSRLRKEVHFFDRHYNRGSGWYMKFFADALPSNSALGEFTPHYIYSPDCAQRIYDFGIKRVLTTLRDPVDRTWSNYIYKRRQDGYQGSLRQFLVDYPEMIPWSSYADHINHWLELFGDEFTVLIYESISRDQNLLCEQLGSALDLDPEKFSQESLERVNSSFIPKHGRIFNYTLRLNKWLVSNDLDRVAVTLKRLPGVMSFVRSPDTSKEISIKPTGEDIDYLSELFYPSVISLQKLIDVEIKMWKSLG